jgi:hypothetical protein
VPADPPRAIMPPVPVAFPPTPVALPPCPPLSGAAGSSEMSTHPALASIKAIHHFRSNCTGHSLDMMTSPIRSGW